MATQIEIPNDSLLAPAVERCFDRPDPPDFSSVTHALEQVITRLIMTGSGPDLGIVPAIIERRVLLPSVPTGALQGEQGHDARTWANKRVYPVLVALKESTGGRVKLSKDAGVSNPYRERVIDEEWLARRKREARYEDLLTMVALLAASSDTVADECLNLVAVRLVERFRSSKIEYRLPRRISRPEMIRLIEEYAANEPNGGRRMECVVAAAAKVVIPMVWPGAEVIHSDPNDPDMCDVLVRDGGDERLIIEVTESSLTVAKLREEVVQRLLAGGTASHALVIAPEIAAYEESAAAEYIERLFNEAGITLAHMPAGEVLAGWMSLSTDDDLQIAILQAVVEELDEFGTLADREGWRDVLTRYWDRTTGSRES